MPGPVRMRIILIDFGYNRNNVVSDLFVMLVKYFRLPKRELWLRGLLPLLLLYSDMAPEDTI